MILKADALLSPPLLFPADIAPQIASENGSKTKQDNPATVQEKFEESCMPMVKVAIARHPLTSGG